MKIAVIDIETTNLQENGGLIVEVGIIELCLETGFMRVIYDELVKEDGYNEDHKNSWIFNNSDLKHEEICKANPLDIQKIQEILNKYPVTAYNKDFDFNFLRSRGIQNIKELPCPMKILTPICKIENEYGFKWPKVQEAYEFLFGKTGYIEAHRGIDDALHEAQIVYRLYERGDFRVNGG